MTFEEHVNEVYRTAFFHIRNISRIRPCLRIDSTETLVHALVTFRLGDYNALLYGLPDYPIQRWTRRSKWSLGSESWIISHQYLLSYTGSPFVTVLFLRSYWTLLRHSIVWLQRNQMCSPIFFDRHISRLNFFGFLGLLIFSILRIFNIF